MSTPAPYEGPCKRVDDGADHDDDVTGLGRYRGLCSICRPLVVEEQRAARESRGHDDSDPERVPRGPGAKQPKLKDACLYLAKRADALDKALERKKLARREAQAALSSFKEQLQLVGRVAQSLLNQSSDKQDEEP